MDDRVERWLSNRVETPAVDAMELLRRGTLPSGTARDAAATFLAYAMVRGPSFRRMLDELSGHGGPKMWALHAISEYRKKHPNFDATEREYADLVDSLELRAPEEVRHSGPAADMRTMMREADRLAPRLRDARWALVESPQRRLMISDTPVVAHHPLHGVAPGPVLWPRGYELFVPVTPKALLIVNDGPHLSVPTLTRELAALFNSANRHRA